MRARALLLTLALPSCGLVSSSDEIVPYPPDGIGGFGEAEPIEVCLGSARVVAPDASSGEGAVCVAEGATARACAADGECAGIERCVCGRCIVEACQGGSCGEGRVCRDRRCTLGCTEDAGCAAGEVCAAGGCARTCAGDGDCHFGERCDKLGNTCRAKPCSEATPCGIGARCEAASVTGVLHEPEVAVVGGAEVAYVELRLGVSRAIYRATVEALTRWTISPETPVIEGDAGEAAGAPSLLLDGDRVEIYYEVGEGAAIGRALSTDGGLSFVKEATPVLSPALDWENGRVASPSVLRSGGTTYLFYEGGQRAGIGLARVAEGVAARVSQEPLAAPATVADPVFWHDVTEVGAPHAMIAGEAVRVYFTARGAEGSDARIGDVPVPADANDSIGLLASLDMKRFSLYPTGPVFARVTNVRTFLGEREGSVRIAGDGAYEMTFVASDASGKSVSGLGVARTAAPANQP